MTITDLTFLFIFLPLSLLVYYLCRENLREYILLAWNLVFYACSSIQYFLLLLVSLSINMLLGWAIARFFGKKQAKTVLLVLGVLYNLTVLGYYKYTDFILNTARRISGMETVLHSVVLPLGLSFFTFKAISYLVDVYLGNIKSQGNPVQAALYLSFFAQIQSGPLSRYHDMEPDCGFAAGEEESFCRFDGFSEGVCQFILGFDKKVLIADVLSNITTEIFAAPSEAVSVSYAWLGAICYSLQLYFDFSGYSDMAIGISRMFGYQCPKNFDYPYMTDSVSGFWKKWHITLGAWFRDYVYIPLGGSRVDRKSRLFFNLFAVWALTGIWHGASWNFVFWGMAYFAAIAFEKAVGWPQKIRTGFGKMAYRVLVLLFINFQWVIFRASGLRAGIRYIRNMFYCPPNALADRRAIFLLKDNFAFIFVAALLCFPVVPWLGKKMCRYEATRVMWELGIVLVYVFLFLWAVSFVIAGQNNPFAYANF